ncbi:MAG: hypothetical protein QOI80_3851 [Solirubrobacteraceae bacterium]|nr:hypothetical protein [Solirubrobacteraceae bacterium]
MRAVEASALRAPALARRPLATPLLRLRSDEQLIALFRAGSDDAFAVIHDRYRQRLFAYIRQMLAAGPRADAEDVLQDVFVRAYGALRADQRDVNLRAWFYRVAHNRCIDHLRRPIPPASEVFEMSRTPLLDPIEAAQRREDLRRLVGDVGRLPEQQRSALLMREIDGLAYADIAVALDVTVPAVKSLLVRARVGLVEAIEARDTDCAVIRSDLLASYDRGVKASGRARRHMRECAGCREYRGALRGMRRSFAALSPVAGFGPLTLAAKALGIGGASGGGAAAGVGGAGAVGGTAAVCKVAAVVCTAALATGGAVEVRHLTKPSGPAPHHAAPAPAHAAAPAAATALRHQVVTTRAASAAPATRRSSHAKAPPATALTRSTAAGPTAPAVTNRDATIDPNKATPGTGGSAAPEDAVTVEQPTTVTEPATPVEAPVVPAATATPAGAQPSGPGPAPTSGPPPEH